LLKHFFLDYFRRAKAKELLRGDESRLASLLDSVPDGVVVVDHAGTIEWVNKQTIELFGYEYDEILGMPVETLLPKRYRTDHVAHRDGYTNAPRVRNMGEELELLGRKKTGDEFPIAVSLSPVSIDQGQRVIASVRDITAQRDDMRRIRDLNKRLSTLLNDAPDGVIVAGADGRITSVNIQAELLFGYDRADLLGQKVEMLLPKPLRERHVGFRSDFATAPRKRSMGAGLDLFGLHKDGTEIPVLVSLSPVDTDDGSQVIAAVRDMTGQKRNESHIAELNARLQRDNNELTVVNRELQAFSASVSHDLRSPLRAIDGFSNALLEDYAEVLDETGQDYLSRVRSGAQRMGLLIDDMLKLSSISRADLNLQEVDLSALARHIADELKKNEPQRDVEFIIADDMLAIADRNLLNIALTNLIGNAFKFTRDRVPGSIEFGTKEENGTPVFFIRDNGAGFEMAHAEQIFDAFKRLHDAREFPGNGVGLATVQRVIHKHGGRIWTNAIVGQGAEFLFTLESEAAT
jgi:PAS domain S-box-containing protein